MSYDIFKQNMLSFMRNQPNIASREQFAKKIVDEYDALIKRGFDTLNGITLQQGNKQLMYDTLLGVLNTAFQQSSGEHAIITNMGKAFQAYWTGVGSGSIIQQIIELFTREEREEAETVATDIRVEYPKTQRLYNSQIPPQQRLTHNRNVNRDDVIKRQLEIEKETSDTGTPTPSPTPSPSPKSTTPSEKGTDFTLKEKCGNGHWPALGNGPAPNFEVSSIDGTRRWYKQNPKFIKENCTQILFPTSSGDVKITVHKDLAAVVEPALKIIKEKNLQKFIDNCAGGLAVRNVTNGIRLSNHSWGTAIDMNSIRYPPGISFKDDGIYISKSGVKIRSLNDFDKGFLQVANIFQSVGMTWLRRFDPMHVSIYE